MTRSTLLAAILGGSLLALGQAQAAENGQINYPVGAAGNNGGFPPIPGVFALEQFSYSSADGLYGDNGKKLPIPFKSQAYAGTTRLLLSYPVELPGHGHLYSQLVLPVVGLNTSFFGQHASTFGLANITVSPLIGQWDITKEFVVAPGLDVALNTGPYDPRNFSVATGHSSIIPVLSLRYDRPFGPDITFVSRFLFNQRNGTTKYLSGTVYAADFEASWHFSQKLKLGAAGGFFTQISDDSSPNGVGPNGNRSNYLTVGPSLTYQTELFGRPININANYQIGAYARNTTKGSTAWLNISIPLFIPGGRPPPKPVE